MKRINKFLTILLSSVILFGCDNFEEINTNPDTPVTAPASMMATYLIREIVRKDRYVKESAEDGLLAKLIVWNESANGLQYNNLGRKNFESHLLLINCNDMVAKAPENNKKGYEALALFVKSYALYYTSLDLGDIPYNEAGKGEEGLTKPKYDLQKEVMLAILNDLEEAYKCFAAANETAFDGDIIFNGNRDSWKKTVTAFQLKVLMNLSKKESDSDVNVKSRFANVVQNGSLMTSNADNFQLTYKDQSGMRYPFNDLTSNQTKYAMHSSVLINMLKEYNDYRIFYYAEPSKAKTEAGATEDSFDAYVGIDPSINYGEVSKAHGANLFCSPNFRYTSTTHSEGEPLIRLGYGEQQMILAEACLRGWINGDANNYYKEGIKANMTFTRDVTPNEYAHNRLITNEYIESYLNGDKIQLTGNFETDLKKVISQKYIASFLQYTYEAYYDYRRTGYPELPINASTSMNSTGPDKFPMRYMYSTDEYAYNRENLDEALQRQFNGNDDINEMMWILK
ncbi:MAG: SusD/RagB family nutrient-binding outer membrane lipoprotein [Tannerella sp.]|jgi:hypothetical protein|nr:SusD/RagB family nutrient-binding outer membrane lipoprotein [Tannerella sp.]